MSIDTSTARETGTEAIPALVAGDRLTRAEFERRYEAMPHVHKAELIEGVVYMPSPVSTDGHAAPQFDLIIWLGHYKTSTPGVQGGDNATLRLDLDNEPQPDAFLRILPEQGGQSQTVDGFTEGAPELVAEVAYSSASYDLHDKLNAYRRNGVREYIVWRVGDRAIDWFVLEEGRYNSLAAADDGLLHSLVFPGLWLDAAALIAGDLNRVLEAARRGTETSKHEQFVQQLQQAGKV